MDWEDYRHLLALSRASSLSAAGEALGVARTTVGRRIGELERRLGVRLFHRAPEGFVLTEAGEDLARAAAQMEEEQLAGEARVLGRDTALRGPLRVSTMDFVYERFVDVFRSFVARYPGVELTVCATSAQVSLRRRETDVAVRLGDTPLPDLVGRRLRTLRFRVYASRALLARVGEGAGLAAFPWLGDDTRGDRPWVDGWLAERAPGARVVLRYDSHAVLRASLRAGIGAHPLAEVEAAAFPELVDIAPELPAITRDLWALTLPELRASRRVRALMDHLQAGFREMAGG